MARSLFFCAAIIFSAISIQPAQLAAQEIQLRFDQYEEKLNALLRTTRDEERDFVRVVVAQMRAGNLPERVVESSYKWVMNKRPFTRYPFVYFARVLQIQTKKLELDGFVPEYDFSIYYDRPPRR